MGLKLNQFEICNVCNVCNVGSLFRWTICKAMVIYSQRECNHEYEDVAR